MKEFLNNIVTALVDNPEEVMISEESDEKTVTYKLRVHSEDVGKVIGKKGRTINAIRTVLRAVSNNKEKKSLLELLQ